MNPVTALLNAFFPLDEPAISSFEQLLQHLSVRRNTEPLRIGDRARYMFFIVKGLGRVYYLHEGEEITDYFAMDGQFLGAVPGAINGEPSYKAIHFIEDSDVYRFSLEELEQCCIEHASLANAIRRLMSFAIIEEQLRIEHLRRYSAAERYHLLEKKYPGLSNRSPLKYIASYLNTSPVSISRIRGGNQ